MPRADYTANKYIIFGLEKIKEKKYGGYGFCSLLWRMRPVRENAVADNGTVEAIRERHGTAAALMHSSLIEGSQSGMQP